MGVVGVVGVAGVVLCAAVLFVASRRLRPPLLPRERDARPAEKIHHVPLPRRLRLPARPRAQRLPPERLGEVPRGRRRRLVRGDVQVRRPRGRATLVDPIGRPPSRRSASRTRTTPSATAERSLAAARLCATSALRSAAPPPRAPPPGTAEPRARERVRRRDPRTPSAPRARAASPRSRPGARPRAPARGEGTQAPPSCLARAPRTAFPASESVGVASSHAAKSTAASSAAADETEPNETEPPASAPAAARSRRRRRSRPGRRAGRAVRVERRARAVLRAGGVPRDTPRERRSGGWSVAAAVGRTIERVVGPPKVTTDVGAPPPRRRRRLGRSIRRSVDRGPPPVARPPVPSHEHLEEPAARGEQPEPRVRRLRPDPRRGHVPERAREAAPRVRPSPVVITVVTRRVFGSRFVRLRDERR